MYFVFVQLLSSGSAWFAIILIVVACLFIDVVKKVLYRHLQPTSTEKAQVIFWYAFISILTYSNPLTLLSCLMQRSVLILKCTC